jgi:hypothetical protein
METLFRCGEKEAQCLSPLALFFMPSWFTSNIFVYVDNIDLPLLPPIDRIHRIHRMGFRCVRHRLLFILCIVFILSPFPSL